MTKTPKSRIKRDIQLTTYVNEAEYAVVLTRFKASSISSWRAYQRQCLLGRTLRASVSLEIGQTYTALGEIGRSLLYSVEALEEIQQNPATGAAKLATEIASLTQSLTTLTVQIQQLQQQLIPVEGNSVSR